LNDTSQSIVSTLLHCGIAAAPTSYQVPHERKHLVLASDEDGSTLDELRFSLASDIVEIVVLTSDDAFLQTLREAVGGARRLWHVPSNKSSANSPISCSSRRAIAMMRHRSPD
jgi:hypothetical protein